MKNTNTAVKVKSRQAEKVNVESEISKAAIGTLAVAAGLVGAPPAANPPELFAVAPANLFVLVAISPSSVQEVPSHDSVLPEEGAVPPYTKTLVCAVPPP